MEPVLVPEGAPGRAELAEKAAHLMRTAPQLTSALRPQMRAVIAGIVTEMNCYYSNLIERDSTRPVEIRKAMQNDYSMDETKRNLQYKAVAHIRTQAMMVEMLKDSGVKPHDPEFIKALHGKFLGELPEHLQLVKGEDGKEMKVTPGHWRETDVKVARHIAPESKDVPDFMARYAEVYGRMRGPLDRIIDVGAAHHRLVWIHPFLDGNGRVARLATDAVFLKEGLNDGGLWALSRGLGRDQDAYRDLLARADQPRQGALDGRGTLTQAGLVEISHHFLDTALDQVEFMKGLIRIEDMERHLRAYVAMRTEADGWHKGTLDMVMAVFDRGELSRGAAIAAAGLKESRGRDVLRTLLDDGILTSKSEKGLLEVGLPIQALPSVMPGLYPQGAVDWTRDRVNINPRQGPGT